MQRQVLLIITIFVMANRIDNLILDQQEIKALPDDLLINGLSLKQMIIDEVTKEAKFIRKFHNEIRAKGSAVHNKLAEKFSFYEQLEAIFSAFEGDNGKLNQIIKELKSIKLDGQ